MHAGNALGAAQGFRIVTAAPFPHPTDPGTVPEIVLYWRPGCPWCSSLRRGLRRAGLATTEVDIWQDPDAASRVRAATGGHETVPTVMIGVTALVNPSTSKVLALTRDAGLPLAPPPSHRRFWRRRRPR
jgi:mycoredoxin